MVIDVYDLRHQHEHFSEHVPVEDIEEAREYARSMGARWGTDCVAVYVCLPDGSHAGRDADEYVEVQTEN